MDDHAQQFAIDCLDTRRKEIREDSNWRDVAKYENALTDAIEVIRKHG